MRRAAAAGGDGLIVPRSWHFNHRPIARVVKDMLGRADSTPGSVLDLGMGCGNYGRVLRRAGVAAELTGVEVWPEYRNPRWERYYDHSLQADVREFLSTVDLASYDVLLLIDVLEHMERDEGQRVLDQMRKVARVGFVISTPISRYPQPGWYGNPHEVHRYFWSDEELREQGLECVRNSIVPTFAPWPPLARSAVYVWSSAR